MKMERTYVSDLTIGKSVLLKGWVYDYRVLSKMAFIVLRDSSGYVQCITKDAKTIKRWLQLLEDLYVIFKVSPYSKRISRALLKEPKYYFYDFASIAERDSAKLENLVASALLKELHYVEDVYGAKGELFFLKTKDSKEIDFLVMIDARPCYLIEVKLADESPHKNFQHFERYFPGVKKIQLVKEIKREKTYPNALEVRSVMHWLSNIDFSEFASH